MTIRHCFSTFDIQITLNFQSIAGAAMKRIMNRLICNISLLTVVLGSQMAWTEIASADDELRIYTGAPQKNGESFISISGRWVMSDGLETGFTGLAFVNGPDQPKPDTAASVAKKVAKSVARGMAYMRGSIRGITATVIKDGEKPGYEIKNKKGISLSSLVIRDFTNDQFTAETGSDSFSASGVKVAFDLAESDIVAQAVVNYSGPSKTFRASGGGIDISIGKKKLVTVKTANKTTEQIEKDLARAIGGKFSSSSLFPVKTEKRDRKNIRPFDGGEVHLNSISAKSYTVEVKDPSIGLITKYQFKEAAQDSGWW